MSSTPSVSKTQRWLDLIAFLAGRRVPVTVEDVMDAVPPYRSDWVEGDETARASVRRKFERDKDELRELGIPIETVRYTINYGLEEVDAYVLSSRDFYLPYLRLVGEDASREEGDAARPPGPPAASAPRFELREDEARAAVDALQRVAELPAFPFRREARSALRKLTFDLGAAAAGGAGESPVRFLEPPGAEGLRDRLALLSDALLRRKEVRFRYYGIYRDEESERRVQPYGLLFQHSHWYLIGHDLDREGRRVFRVGRMDDVEVNRARAKSADYEVPADFHLREWAGRPPWALPGQDDEPPLDVTVRFDFPRSLWAERNRHGELVEGLDGGGQLRRFRVQDAAPFLRWLLPLRGEARVESPPEMQRELERLARRVAELHGAPAGGGAEGPEGADG